MTQITTVTLDRSETEDDFEERLHRAIEPELAEAGVSPEQVRLHTITVCSGTFGHIEIEVKAR